MGRKHTHTHTAQASFQILRLSATSRLSHLLRTVPPSITCQAAANYDALVEWALASIIAGDGAAAAGLPTAEEVAHGGGGRGAGGGGGGERGGGGGGGVGAGVLDSENNERIRWQPSLIGRLS